MGSITFGEGSVGQYTIYNGLALETNINVGTGEDGSGNFSQYGGTVIAQSLGLGGNGAHGNYSLTNGTLQAGEIGMSDSIFRQSGGQVITTLVLFLEGAPADDYFPAQSHDSYDISRR